MPIAKRAGGAKFIVPQNLRANLPDWLSAQGGVRTGLGLYKNNRLSTPAGVDWPVYTMEARARRRRRPPVRTRRWRYTKGASGGWVVQATCTTDHPQQGTGQRVGGLDPLHL